MDEATTVQDGTPSASAEADTADRHTSICASGNSDAALQPATVQTLPAPDAGLNEDTSRLNEAASSQRPPATHSWSWASSTSAKAKEEVQGTQRAGPSIRHQVAGSIAQSSVASSRSTHSHSVDHDGESASFFSCEVPSVHNLLAPSVAPSRNDLGETHQAKGGEFDEQQTGGHAASQQECINDLAIPSSSSMTPPAPSVRGKAPSLGPITLLAPLNLTDGQGAALLRSSGDTWLTRPISALSVDTMTPRPSCALSVTASSGHRSTLIAVPATVTKSLPEAEPAAADSTPQGESLALPEFEDPVAVLNLAETLDKLCGQSPALDSSAQSEPDAFPRLRKASVSSHVAKKMSTMFKSRETDSVDEKHSAVPPPSAYRQQPKVSRGRSIKSRLSFGPTLRASDGPVEAKLPASVRPSTTASSSELHVNVASDSADPPQPSTCHTPKRRTVSSLLSSSSPRLGAPTLGVAPAPTEAAKEDQQDHASTKGNKPIRFNFFSKVKQKLMRRSTGEADTKRILGPGPESRLSASKDGDASISDVRVRKLLSFPATQLRKTDPQKQARLSNSSSIQPPTPGSANIRYSQHERKAESAVAAAAASAAARATRDDAASSRRQRTQSAPRRPASCFTPASARADGREPDLDEALAALQRSQMLLVQVRPLPRSPIERMNSQRASSTTDSKRSSASPVIVTRSLSAPRRNAPPSRPPSFALPPVPSSAPAQRGSQVVPTIVSVSESQRRSVPRDASALSQQFTSSTSSMRSGTTSSSDAAQRSHQTNSPESSRVLAPLTIPSSPRHLPMEMQSPSPTFVAAMSDPYSTPASSMSSSKDNVAGALARHAVAAAAAAAAASSGSRAAFATAHARRSSEIDIESFRRTRAWTIARENATCAGSAATARDANDAQPPQTAGPALRSAQSFSGAKAGRHAQAQAQTSRASMMSIDSTGSAWDTIATAAGSGGGPAGAEFGSPPRGTGRRGRVRAALPLLLTQMPPMQPLPSLPPTATPTSTSMSASLATPIHRQRPSTDETSGSGAALPSETASGRSSFSSASAADTTDAPERRRSYTGILASSSTDSTSSDATAKGSSTIEPTSPRASLASDDEYDEGRTGGTPPPSGLRASAGSMGAVAAAASGMRAESREEKKVTFASMVSHSDTTHAPHGAVGLPTRQLSVCQSSTGSGAESSFLPLDSLSDSPAGTNTAETGDEGGSNNTRGGSGSGSSGGAVSVRAGMKPLKTMTRDDVFYRSSSAATLRSKYLSGGPLGSTSAYPVGAAGQSPSAVPSERSISSSSTSTSASGAAAAVASPWSPPGKQSHLPPGVHGPDPTKRRSLYNLRSSFAFAPAPPATPLSPDSVMRSTAPPTAASLAVRASIARRASNPVLLSRAGSSSSWVWGWSGTGTGTGGTTSSPPPTAGNRSGGPSSSVPPSPAQARAPVPCVPPAGAGLVGNMKPILLLSTPASPGFSAGVDQQQQQLLLQHRRLDSSAGGRPKTAPGAAAPRASP
ncbi:hypothetical protein OC842_006264 [Tilletia horrida]|uniref:Uncharacterized protein n=1 Tax=Tilletia horrida TaxID=155126 RepID=A0AAN6JHU5_9BASI|nr:hypothetical protein OC842_006264 [Tilletia horrida]